MEEFEFYNEIKKFSGDIKNFENFKLLELWIFSYHNTRQERTYVFKLHKLKIYFTFKNAEYQPIFKSVHIKINSNSRFPTEEGMELNYEEFLDKYLRCYKEYYYLTDYFQNIKIVWHELQPNRYYNILKY